MLVSWVRGTVYIPVSSRLGLKRSERHMLTISATTHADSVETLVWLSPLSTLGEVLADVLLVGVPIPLLARVEFAELVCDVNVY